MITRAPSAFSGYLADLSNCWLVRFLALQVNAFNIAEGNLVEGVSGFVELLLYLARTCLLFDELVSVLPDGWGPEVVLGLNLLQVALYLEHKMIRYPSVNFPLLHPCDRASRGEAVLSFWSDLRLNMPTHVASYCASFRFVDVRSAYVSGLDLWFASKGFYFILTAGSWRATCFRSGGRSAPNGRPYVDRGSYPSISRVCAQLNKCFIPLLNLFG